MLTLINFITFALQTIRELNSQIENLQKQLDQSQTDLVNEKSAHSQTKEELEELKNKVCTVLLLFEINFAEGSRILGSGSVALPSFLSQKNPLKIPVLQNVRDLLTE